MTTQNTVSSPMSLLDLAAAQTLRVDTPRNEPKVRLRVAFMSNGLVMPDGSILSRTEESLRRGDPFEFGEVTVYESEVASVLRMVETATERDLDMVVHDLVNHVEEAQEEHGHGRPYLPSFQASFNHVMRRDLRALVSVERLNDDGTAMVLERNDAVAKTVGGTKMVQRDERWTVETVEDPSPAPVSRARKRGE